MNEKKIRIIEAIMWIVISVILAICDFAKGGALYVCFGIIFAAISVGWCYLLARYIDDYKE